MEYMLIMTKSSCKTKGIILEVTFLELYPFLTLSKVVILTDKRKYAMFLFSNLFSFMKQVTDRDKTWNSSMNINTVNCIYFIGKKKKSVAESEKESDSAESSSESDSSDSEQEKKKKKKKKKEKKKSKKKKKEKKKKKQKQSR
jgi:hypothetical protein